MAKIDVKDISSIMVFTGANSLNNALALENREYGYEDEFIGKLTKTASNDSAFNKVTGEIFIETTPKYNNVDDLTILAYSYIINKSSEKPTNTMYLNTSNIINFDYTYENDLQNNVANIVNGPCNDIKLYLASLNNAMYNKQKFYAKNNEIEYITYNGIKYYWQKPGTILNESYNKIEHNIGNDYVSYSLIGHEMQAEIWDAYTYTYIPVFETVTNPETNETSQVPLMETRYEVEYMYRIGDIVNGKLNEISKRYNDTYKENDFNSYYLYNLNHKLSFICNTYSFGKQTFDVYSNYDGEFNNLFNNVISFNVENVESLNNIKMADVILGEEYWTNITVNENEYLCGNEKYPMDSNIELIVSSLNESNVSDLHILSPYKIKKLDISVIANNLSGVLDLSCDYNKKIDAEHTIRTNWIKEKGVMLEELIIGKESINCNINEIVGLDYLSTLKKLDITGCNKLSNLDISKLANLEEFNANNTSITVFQPAQYTTIKNVTLPDTIETIILDDINVDGMLNYEPNVNLTSLEFNNVTGFDSFNFVSTWLDKLSENNILSSGLVNFVNLNGVDWDNVPVNKLIDLKNIELKEFTGRVNIVGEFNQYISRLDYRLLRNLYGDEAFNSENSLVFNVELTDDAFKLNIKALLPKTEKFDEVEITTYEEIGSVDIDVIDNVSGNSLLNDIQLNPDLYEDVKLDSFTNNKKTIGVCTTIETVLESNDKSEYISNLEIGDVLLYNDKLVIVSKNTININTNYIKIGVINDTDMLMTILDTLQNNTEYKLVLTASETLYNNEDTNND